jgi:hypothetical protein
LIRIFSGKYIDTAEPPSEAPKRQKTTITEVLMSTDNRLVSVRPPTEWSSTLELTDSTDFVEAAKKIGRLRGMA